MKKLVALSVIFMLWANIVYAQSDSAKKKENTCYIENVTAKKGTSFPVKVFVNNVDTLAGMQVPLKYMSETVDLKCDSVSFAGSRCSYFALSFPIIEPIGKVAFFCFINMADTAKEVAPLMPGDGQVATLWFTADSKINAGKVDIQGGPKIFIQDDRRDYSWLFWTPQAQQVVCRYIPGTITIE